MSMNVPLLIATVASLLFLIPLLTLTSKTSFGYDYQYEDALTTFTSQSLSTDNMNTVTALIEDQEDRTDKVTKTSKGAFSLIVIELTFTFGVLITSISSPKSNKFLLFIVFLFFIVLNVAYMGCLGAAVHQIKKANDNTDKITEIANNTYYEWISDDIKNCKKCSIAAIILSVLHIPILVVALVTLLNISGPSSSDKPEPQQEREMQVQND